MSIIRFMFGGSESHLSGCFRLFAPTFWEVIKFVAYHDGHLFEYSF